MSVTATMIIKLYRCRPARSAAGKRLFRAWFYPSTGSGLWPRATWRRFCVYPAAWG